MSDKICRLPEVINQTGLARSTLYAKVKNGDFPKPIKISTRSVGWLKTEIDKWLDEKIENSLHS